MASSSSGLGDTCILVGDHTARKLPVPSKPAAASRTCRAVTKGICAVGLLGVLAFLVAAFFTLNSMASAGSDAGCLNDPRHGRPTTELRLELANNTAVAHVAAVVQPLSSFHSAVLSTATCRAYEAETHHHAATVAVAAAPAAATLRAGQPSRVELTITMTGEAAVREAVYELDCTIDGELLLFGALTLPLSLRRSITLDTRPASAGAAAAQESSVRPSLLSLVRVVGGVPNAQDPMAGAQPLTLNASASFAELARRANASQFLKAGAVSIPAFAYHSHLEESAVSDSESKWNVTFTGVEVDVVSNVATGGFFHLSARQRAQPQPQPQPQRQRRELSWLQDFNAGRATCLADKQARAGDSPLVGDSTNRVHWLLPFYDTAKAVYSTDHATLYLTPTDGAPKLLPYGLAEEHTFSLNVAADPGAYHVCFFGVFDHGVVDSELCFSAKDDAYWRGSLVMKMENKTMVSGDLKLDKTEGTELSGALQVDDLVSGTDHVTLVFNMQEKAASSRGGFAHTMLLRVGDVGENSSVLVDGAGTCTQELWSHTEEQRCSTYVSVSYNNSNVASISAPAYGWSVAANAGDVYVKRLAAVIHDVDTIGVTATAEWQDGAAGYSMDATAAVTDFDGAVTTLAVDVDEASSGAGFKHTATLALNRADKLGFELAAVGVCKVKFFRDEQACSTTTTATDTKANAAVFILTLATDYGWSLHNPESGALELTKAQLNITDAAAVAAGARLAWQTSTAEDSISGNVFFTDGEGKTSALSASMSETAPVKGQAVYNHAADATVEVGGGAATSLAVAGSCGHPALTLVAEEKDCATTVVVTTGNSSFTMDLAKYGWSVANGAGSMFLEMEAAEGEVAASAALDWGGPAEDFGLVGNVAVTLGETVIEVGASFDEVASANTGVYAHQYRGNITAGTAEESLQIRVAADGACDGDTHFNLDFDDDKNCTTAMSVLVNGSKVLALSVGGYGWQFHADTSALYVHQLALLVEDTASVAMHFVYDFGSLPHHAGKLAFSLGLDVFGDGGAGGEEKAFLLGLETAAMWHETGTDFKLDGSLVASQEGGTFKLETGVQLLEAFHADDGLYTHAMQLNVSSADLGVDARMTANGTCTSEYFDAIQAGCSSTAQVRLDGSEVVRVDVAKYGWAIRDSSSAAVGVPTQSSVFVTAMKIDVDSEDVEEIGMTMAAGWSKTSFVKADARVLDLDVAASYGHDATTVQVNANTVMSDEHASGFGRFNSTQPSGAVVAMQVHDMFVGRSAYTVAVTGRADAADALEANGALATSDYALVSSSTWATDMSDPAHSAFWQFIQEFDWMGDVCLDGDDFSYTHKSEVRYSMAAGTFTALEISLPGVDFDAMTAAERGLLQDGVAMMLVDHSPGGAVASYDVKEVRLAKQVAGSTTRRARADGVVTATVILGENVDTEEAAALVEALNKAMRKGDLKLSVQVNGELHTITVTQQVSASLVRINTTAPPTQGNSTDGGLGTDVIAAIAAGAAVLVLALVVAVAVVRSNGSSCSRGALQYDEPPSPPRTPTSLRKVRVSPSPSPADSTAPPQYETEKPPQYGLVAEQGTGTSMAAGDQAYLSAARPSQRVNKIAKVSTAASLASLGAGGGSKPSLAEVAEVAEDNRGGSTPAARGTLVAEN